MHILTINKILFLFLFFTFSLFAKEINIDSIVQNSLQSNKHLFVFLHKNNCSYCENMITFTLDDEAIQEEIVQHFIFVDINVSDLDVVTYQKFKGSGYEFAKYVGYNFYPSSLFIDKSKNMVYSVAGYQEEDKFLKILQYVHTHSYQTKKEKDF